MKGKILGFLKRGIVSFGFGPLVLAVLYLILKTQGVVDTLAVEEVCLGIISLSLLAFIAGGMNFIYKIESLPLMVAILIHGGILYVCYLATYLVNGWLESGITPFLVFTGIFIFGYLAIWIIIYAITRNNTAKLNESLHKKQKNGMN